MARLGSDRERLIRTFMSRNKNNRVGPGVRARKSDRNDIMGEAIGYQQARVKRGRPKSLFRQPSPRQTGFKKQGY